MSSLMKNLAIGMTIALGVGLGSGCASLKVNSYLDRGSDLRRYRTFNWGSPDTWSIGDPRLDNNRFFDERVRAQVEKQLASRGFEKSESQPDLLVHYHASVSQEIDVRELDAAGSYCADRDCRPFIYDRGTLFVDLVEPRTDKIIWRGWSEGSIDGVVDDQAWMERHIDEAVARILTRLPPRL